MRTLEVWQLFVSWYGGGPACKREVVPTMSTVGLADGSGGVEQVVDGFELELYPPVLTFRVATPSGQPSRRPAFPRVVSRVATIAEAKGEANTRRHTEAPDMKPAMLVIAR